jgi:ubiquinone/menaquinone biosynthesis C-methylase UbiE
VGELQPAHEEILATWDALAAFWDDQMEAGRTWQRTLIQPAVEQLLGLEPGEQVLEVACGNGEFSRRMTELGGRVLATDLSGQMLERARARGGPIEYRLADATNEEAMLALGEPASFDAVVCNMAIMDIAAIEPMVSACARLLKRGGRFVFSTLHPAFNNAATRLVEQSENENGVVRTYSVKVSRYIHPSTGMGVAIEGQPVAQWYFHRPIGELFRVWFRHGFLLDGIEEPVLAQADIRPGSTASVFVEVPPILAARMRLPR